MNDDTLLEIKDLRVSYKIFEGRLRVLNGLQMKVARGERVGLVGETGCGKTTAMKAVLRILPSPAGVVEGGRILFNGSDVLAMRPPELQALRSRGIAMIFQDPTAALNPVFTVGEQMTEVIRYALPPEQRRDHVLRDLARKALKDVYLPDQDRILGNYPMQLSGGMRQRICISMAITTPRDLLIADEPGTSLDVTIQDQVLRLLRELVEKKGTSIILITHSLGVAREMTDRVYVMYGGAIVEVAKTADLFREPLHPYTHGLFASVPKISGGGVSGGIPGSIPDYLRPPSGCRFHPRCGRATEECRQSAPGFYDQGDGHCVACFLYRR
jgi:peptide/nickel transport system ATP-binding protein